MSEAAADIYRINLIDWRSAARERKRQRFIAMLIGVAIATIAIAGVLPIAYYNHRINQQQTRNDYLKGQISVAEGKLARIRSIKKVRKNLVNRMHVIERLQKSRSSIVHYFDQLVATLPDGVYLTSLAQSKDTTTLKGVAESNARVSQYMVQLDDSASFTNPRLIVIKRDKQGSSHAAKFTLKVDSSSPETPSSDQAQDTAIATPGRHLKS